VYDENIVEFCGGRFDCVTSLPADTHVKITVDFDDVELMDDEEDGTIGATIISAIYKGSYWQYIVRTDDYYDFFVDNDYEWTLNDRVGIKIAPDKIVLEPIVKTEEENKENQDA